MRHVFSSVKMICSLIAIGTVSLLSCNSNETTVTTDDAASTSTATATNEPATPAVSTHAEATITSTYSDTTVNGTIKFDADSAGKVLMTLDITIPAKAGKSVAVHIHEHGNCGDTATLAHGHWNPTNAQHGKWASDNYHSGDIGNIKLDSKGKGTLSLTSDRWSIGGAADKNLLGKAIIVHGGMDDYKTQPTGNSGNRIGCGVIN